MTVRKFISTLTVCLLVPIIFSCKTSPKLSFKITQLDTSIKTTKISIAELADNYKKYQGQYIETTGKFHQAFEEFAIYTNKNFWTGEARGFWLGTVKELNIDNASFEKMNDKQITIKGFIDTTSKGHLSSYLATIRRIYFWQEK